MLESRAGRSSVRLPSETRLEIRVRETEAGECTLHLIGFPKCTKEARPVETRALHDVVDGDQALVVRDLRLRRAEAAEAALEAAERHHAVAACRRQPAPGGLRVVAFKELRQPLVQPRRDTLGRRAGDHRVNELVGEHALE